jgi:hypothetical protein
LRFGYVTCTLKAMKVKAQVLRAGNWKHQNGVYHCDAATVKHHQKRFQEVANLGYVMPYSIEHDQFELMTLSDYEKNKDKFLGKAESVEAAKDGKGLDVVLDVPNEKDGKYLRGMRHVSPGIRSDVQLGGKTLPGETICHIAATALPCQDQAAIATLSHMVRLSFGEDDVADESKEKPKEKEGEGGDSDTGRLKKVLKALAKVGLMLPDDTTEENLCERLETAALTLDGGEGGDPKPAEESSNPVIMSLVKRLVTTEKNLLGERAAALFKSGRIDKPTLTRLQTALKTVQLSLAPKTGELNPNAVAMKIEAYEELPAGAMFAPGANDGQTLLAVTPPPEATGGRPETAEDAEKIDKQLDEMHQV